MKVEEVKALESKYMTLYEKYEDDKTLDENDEIVMNEIRSLNILGFGGYTAIKNFFKVLELVVENEERK